VDKGVWRKARLDMPATELEVVEMDEMHTYIAQKKRLLAVDCS